ncbi:MAG: M14 family zinc carboxypeptidase, partial [Elusimicrobia bacterium]|nr:M14 family zinc carboxypeptidase [Elusimicrobiota bacterium]
MINALAVLLVALCAALPARAGNSAEDSNRALSQLKKQARKSELPSVSDPAASLADQRFWIVVRAAGRSQRTEIAEAGMAIEEVRDGQVLGVAHAKTVERLKALGYVVESKVPMSKLILDFPPADKAYHDYGRMKAALDALALANPKLVSVFSVGKGWQGRDIWCARFNTTQSGTAPSAKPGALFVGNH